MEPTEFSFQSGDDVTTSIKIEPNPKAVSPNTLWKCDECSKEFPCRKTLFTHKRCHKWNYVHCIQCNREFSTEHTLKQHIQYKHIGEHKEKIRHLNVMDMDADFDANADTEITASAIKPVKQIALIKYKNKFICDYCGNDFLSIQTLQKHFSYHAENNFQLIQCKLCLLLFTNHSTRMEHEKNHYVDLVYCNICNNSFSNIINLKCHTARYHSASSYWYRGENVAVSKKNARTKMKDDESKAKNKKREKQNLLCNICGISTTSNSSLVSHMRFHTREKPFKCTFCDKAFPLPGTLKVHMRRHTGERPYICQLCPKTFLQLPNLKQHINNHHPDETKCKHKCSICNKVFLLKCYLVNHMKKHNNKRLELECENCNKFFNTKRLYNEHLEVCGNL